MHILTIPFNEWIKLLGEFYNHYGYLSVFLGTLGENTAIQITCNGSCISFVSIR